MDILFCGDIMPGGVLPYQDSFVSPQVMDLLQSVDFRVGTLECAIGDNLPFDKKKMSPNGRKNIVYAREKDFGRVKKLGINLVTLANNHIFDLGLEGLNNTIRLLDENCIYHCGAGINIKEASKPCSVIIAGKTYAFIGCCFKGLPPSSVEIATDNNPGVFQTDDTTICDLIKQTKKEADVVIILPHWGVEYSVVPPLQCEIIAKKMIDAGADAIIGSHTHIMNPRTKYKGKPIYYSLGNFLFPDFCLQVPRPIDYPETKEDVYSLPIVYNYPKTIEYPVRVVWKQSSRIGVVPVLDFSDKNVVFHTCSFVELDKDNILQLLVGWRRKKELAKMMFFGNQYGAKLKVLYKKIKCRFEKANIRQRLKTNIINEE